MNIPLIASIAIIYNIIIHYLVCLMFNGLEYEEKNEYGIVTLIFASIVAFVAAYVFNNNDKTNLYYGFLIGGMLLLSSLLFTSSSNTMGLLLSSIVLGIIIYYTYDRYD